MSVSSRRDARFYDQLKAVLKPSWALLGPSWGPLEVILRPTSVKVQFCSKMGSLKKGGIENERLAVARRSFFLLKIEFDKPN